MPPVRRAPTRKPDGGGVKKASPRRLIKEGSLFTDWEAWVRIYSRFGYRPLRGRVTISGFRCPEVLSQFGRVAVGVKNGERGSLV
jgi:hypothetical protein